MEFQTWKKRKNNRKNNEKNDQCKIKKIGVATKDENELIRARTNKKV